MTTATKPKIELYCLRSTIDRWPYRNGLYSGVRVTWLDQPLILRPEWIESAQRTCARLKVEYGISDLVSAVGILAAEKARQESGR